MPLLCHYDERVRKGTHTFFQQLYGNTDAIPPETVEAKYNSARGVLEELMLKFSYERDLGRHRSIIMPLVETCRLLAHQLYVLSQNEQDEIQQFQNPNDSTLIAQFDQEVEARLRLWPHDAGTPMSQSEAFDQSDYGSESDDAHEILEN